MAKSREISCKKFDRIVDRTRGEYAWRYEACEEGHNLLRKVDNSGWLSFLKRRFKHGKNDELNELVTYINNSGDRATWDALLCAIKHRAKLGKSIPARAFNFYLNYWGKTHSRPKKKNPKPPNKRAIRDEAIIWTAAVYVIYRNDLIRVRNHKNRKPGEAGDPGCRSAADVMVQVLRDHKSGPVTYRMVRRLFEEHAKEINDALLPPPYTNDH